MTLSKSTSFALFVLFSFFASCSDTNEQNGSKDHQEVVKLDRLAQDIYDEEKETVKQIESVQQKMMDTLKSDSIPDQGKMNKLINYNNVLAKCNGLLEKHHLMLQQQKEYIEKHENTALGTAEIIAQHQQIKDNYATIISDSAYLKTVYSEINTYYKLFSKSE